MASDCALSELTLKKDGSPSVKTLLHETVGTADASMCYVISSTAMSKDLQPQERTHGACLCEQNRY
jgi:hypothetical protein